MYNLSATNKLQHGGTHFATLLTITVNILRKDWEAEWQGNRGGLHGYLAHEKTPTPLGPP